MKYLRPLLWNKLLISITQVKSFATFDKQLIKHFLCTKLLLKETQFYVLLAKSIKVNLHSIRFSYVFVRFFTFLLLLYKVCAFSSAFLCVHIRTNQTVTYWTKVFRKNFFVKGYISISKYRSYRSYTKFLNKIFIYI